MTYQEAEKRFRELNREIDFLQNIRNTLSWDMRVNLPLNAAEYRGNSIAFLSGEMMKRKTGAEMNDLLCALEEKPAEDPILAAMIKKCRKEYKYQAELDPALFMEYSAHNLQCEVVWQECRKNNDFKTLAPWMEKEFDLLRRLQACHGWEKDPMSGLMNEWEPGITRKEMDKLFEELKAFELPFLEQLKSAPNQPDGAAYLGHYPVDKQKELCKYVLDKIGFDFTRGRCDVSAHPYTTGNDINDIRLTTSYFEDNFTRAVCACMHEGGHALTGQNCDPALRYTTLEHLTGAGMNEAQSRFLENIIARGPEYWEFLLPKAAEYFPELKRFDPLEFNRSMNSLHFSSHRLKSDELTYNLHIILRYELEKMLFDGDIPFKDLPHFWNEKSKEYLGVVPETDSEGVLQDMHWCSGYIGYFHTYVLGNFYDGHMYNAIRKDMPDMFEDVKKGELLGITGWMKDKLHRHGGLYQPTELLKMLDGEELTAKHYIDYIKERYGRIYQL
ncbi:MAG: carboxypeptidase M32 [Firmicutes bacterium]|nr:carboxypeptidase M32 [Bacillota bacterium]